MRKLGMVYRYSYEELVQPKQELVVFRLYQMNLADPGAPVYDVYWNRYENHFVEELGQPRTRAATFQHPHAQKSRRREIPAAAFPSSLCDAKRKLRR